MYKSAVFDLDGTLLNTLGDLHTSVNYALKKNNMPERGIDEVRAFVGNGIANLIAKAVPEGTADTAAVLADFRAHYGAHCRDMTAPYDGIIAALDMVAEQGIKIGVVSNKLESAVKVLCREYFGDRIGAVIGDVEGRPKKPSPEPVLAVLDRLGVKPGETVYIGDSDVDVITARACGMDCIAVTWGFRDREKLLNAGAELMADTPAEMAELIIRGAGKAGI